MTSPAARTIEEMIPVAVLALRLERGDKVVEDTPPVPTNPLEWAILNRRLEGREFTLKKFMALRDIYLDTHPHIVIMKPAQRGLSEYAINAAMFALEHGATAWGNGEKDGINVAYVFPTLEALGDFSKERLTGLEEESARLARLFGDHDEFNAIRFKQIGRSYLYLRGGSSVRALKTFPADVLFLDEFDEHSTQAVALARRRMNASEIKREVDLSTPTIPGRGIHRAYQESDQRVYQTLHSCGQRVSFDFFRDVMVGARSWSDVDADRVERGWKVMSPAEVLSSAVWLRCPSCRTGVKEAERCAPGSWHVTHPEITKTHGYHVPWWPWSFIDLQSLAASAVSPDPEEVRQFYNSDLGLPWGEGGEKLQLEDLLAMDAGVDQLAGPVTSVVGGLDVGARLHYWITGRQGGREVTVAVGSVREFEEVDGLMGKHGIGLLVVDAAPEGHEVDKLKARFPGRVISAGYPANATGLKTSMLAPLKEGQPNRDLIMAQKHVQVNRTAAMDAVSLAIKGRTEVWPTAVCWDPEVQAHLLAPEKVRGKDKTGQEVATWVHTAPDHLFHSRVYALVARRLLVEVSVSTQSEAPNPGYHHADRRRSRLWG